MCGIFGYVAWDREMPASRDLCAVTNLLRHRGPDGGGYWEDPGVFFGHRRLAIIDLSTGEQPMASADARYVITFNGEIYNYPELRDELRHGGATFQTTSDTEVILAGYAAWGPDVAARLEGMFAFGLYDRLERTLLVARDRFGEKPLLFSDAGGRVVFASELSPLVSAGVGEGAIDIDALGGYLCLNYVPGTRTMLRGIERLGPAQWRLYGPEGLRRSATYWRLPVSRDRQGAGGHAAGRPAPRADHALLDELQDRLDHAVRLTLRSDVPVGLFLSGGVDSSLVAQAAARLGRLEAAFCADVTTEGFSEWRGASHVARTIGVELVRVPVDARVLGEFLDVTRHLDDPLADSSAMNVWSVSRAASRRLKVVLSGDGGDELFGGYLTYAASAWHARLRPLLPTAAWSALARAGGHLAANDRVKVGLGYKLQRFLRAMPLPSREAHFTWNGTWLPAQAAALASDDRLRAAARDALHHVAPGADASAGVSMHDFQVTDIREYLVNDILAKVDRATMAHGLESRAPLLNTAVAELALSLPDRLRTSGGTTKVALRELCARHFGRAHAFAPKQGFSIPIHGWLRHEGRALMTGLLAPERVDQLGLLDSAAVTDVVQRHLAGRPYGWELWGLMVLVAWFEERVLRPPHMRRLPEARDLRAITCTPVRPVDARR